MILLGVVVALACGVFAALILATRRTFEWFMAWRYLRRKTRGSRTLLVVGLVLGVVAVVALLLARIWENHYLAATYDASWLNQVSSVLYQGVLWLAQGGLKWIGFFLLVIASWLTVLGALIVVFSTFSAVSIFGNFLGSSALVIVLSVMAGFKHDLREKILGTRAHATVTKFGQTFGDYDSMLSTIRRDPDLVASSPFLEGEILITSASGRSGILLYGIDPPSISSVTDLNEFLNSDKGTGRLDYLSHPEKLARLAPSDRLRSMDDDDPESLPTKHDAKHEEISTRPVYPGIVIGTELAATLRVNVGDDVTLISPLGGMSPIGPIPKTRLFRVAGIFYSGSYEFDTGFAYVMLGEAQRFLDLGDEISGVEIKVRDIERVHLVTQRLQQTLGQHYEAKTWQERNRNLFSALKLEKYVMFIVLAFIILVASLSIVTNLTMVVLEKIREIATMKSLGSSDRAVRNVFVYAGVYMGVVGSVAGLVEGVAICSLLTNMQFNFFKFHEIFYTSRLPIQMDLVDVVIIGMVSVVLSVLATLYPSSMASRLDPVEGLRYEL